MTLFARLLASGAFVTLLPLGFLMARMGVTRRTRDLIALSLPLGIAVMSFPLLAAALCDRLDARWVGAFGWLVALITLVASWKRRARVSVTALLVEPNRHAMLVALFGCAAVVYALAVVETPIGTRDEGLYTLAALALDRAGTVLIAAPGELARQSGLFEPFVSGIPFHLPGIPAAATLKPQFSLLLPAWIAQLHGTGGDTLLYRFNLLVTLASAGVTYALSRRVLRRPIALVALALLVFNPAQVWIARINLAEPLGAMLVLAGLLVALDAVREGGRAHIAFAVMLLSLAAYVRIDAIIVAPLFTASAVACATWGQNRAQAATLLRLGHLALVAQALAIAALAAWSPAYIGDHLRILLLAPTGVVAGVLVYHGACSMRRRGLLDARMRRRAAIVVCAAVVLLTAYALLARPFIGPFALIPDRGSALAGMRDYREDSLWNLAAYVTWPCIALALVGAIITLARGARGVATTTALTLTVFAIGSSVVYLAAPAVSPDHPWAIRRMVMLVIPVVAVVAGIGLQALMQRTLRWRQTPVPQVILVGAAGWLLVSQYASLVFTENAGATAQFRELERALPRGSLIVRGFDGVATTLALGFGRQVLPLRDETVAVDAASRAFWASCATAPCTLLHASYEGLDGLVLGPAREFRVERTFIEPNVHAPARERGQQTLQMLVSEVTGLATTPPPPNAGASRDWRIDDAGFHRDELTLGLAVRWTTADARLAIQSAKPQSLELQIASAAPVSQPLQIAVDGVRMLDDTLQSGEARWRLPIGAGRHELTLHTAPFVPAESQDGQDKRSLGVLVRAVRLIDGDVPQLSRASPARDYHSNLVVRRTALDPQDQTRTRTAYRIDVDNLGRAEWPAATNGISGNAAVALGVYFTALGDTQRLAEQRIALPYSLRPGEHWTTAYIVDDTIEPLRSVPAGDYNVHFGLVFDGVAWFADHGERSVSMPITIAPR